MGRFLVLLHGAEIHLHITILIQSYITIDMEKQKTIPLDESYHSRLKRIAIRDKATMKAKVQEWIAADRHRHETG